MIYLLILTNLLALVWALKERKITKQTERGLDELAAAIAELKEASGA